LANLKHLNVEIAPTRWPKTAAFTQRILSRPSFAPWIERESAFLVKAAA
jgi:glutathione S-transferase